MRSAYASRSSSVHDAVSDVELARRIPLHPSCGQLLELDPENPRTVGSTRGIDRHRLAADDRRLGREQPALGFVDRARDTVEPGVTWTIAVRARRSSPFQSGSSLSAKWICISPRP